jgi:hypothetical protein
LIFKGFFLLHILARLCDSIAIRAFLFSNKWVWMVDLIGRWRECLKILILEIDISMNLEHLHWMWSLSWKNIFHLQVYIVIKAFPRSWYVYIQGHVLFCFIMLFWLSLNMRICYSEAFIDVHVWYLLYLVHFYLFVCWFDWFCTVKSAGVKIKTNGRIWGWECLSGVTCCSMGTWCMEDVQILSG